MDCYVINLAEDTERLAATLAALAPYPWLRVRRIEAVPLGTLGCTLSHRKAWAEVVAGGEMALVLEDDANPCLLDNLLWPLPPGEVIFCNDRMAGYGTLLAAAKAARRHYRGYGSDGYLVTPTGARVLLGHCPVKGDLDVNMVEFGLRGTLPMGVLDIALTRHDEAAPSSRRRIEG